MAKRLTAQEVIEKLGIKINSNIKLLKLQKLIDELYSKAHANVSSDYILSKLTEILVLDPELSAIDDIYIYSYGGGIKIELKYTFFPKKLVEYGVFKQVDAYVVKEDEEFKVHIKNGDTEIEHISNPFKSSGETIGAYARGVKPDGTVVIALANKEELENAAKASKMGKNTTWKNWFDEMAKKVPLKRLVKMVPIPEELSTAINIDNTNYNLEAINKSEKAEDAKDAFEELNEELTKKHLISDILEMLNIPHEVKNGYIKVAKKDIPEELAKRFRLQEFKKAPDNWVGKNIEIEYEIEETKESEDEIVYEYEE